MSRNNKLAVEFQKKNAVNIEHKVNVQKTKAMESIACFVYV